MSSKMNLFRKSNSGFWKNLAISRKPSISFQYRQNSKLKEFSIDRSALGKFEVIKDLDRSNKFKELPSLLSDDLYSYISWKGPITMHDYMSQALNHAAYGYYQNKNEKIGETGDFITSPEISQLFGEMIGLWCYLNWIQLNKPDKIYLIELGPGKGTLMKDILKVGSSFPHFQKAVTVKMVELSTELRKVQYETLTGKKFEEKDKIKDSEQHKITENTSISWHSYLNQIPYDAPAIIIGQEFLDAFPIHQFVYTEDGWREKLIDVDTSNDSPYHFRFVLSPGPTPASQTLIRKEFVNININQTSESLKPGDSLEISPLALSTCEDIANRVLNAGGASLLIDYGEDFTQGDTLRGFKKHNQINVLSEPGNVDMTADVDFSMCRRVSEKKGAYIPPLLTQGQFLMNMGIAYRLEQLINRDDVTDEDATNLFHGFKKLVDSEEMGKKFKVMAMSNPKVTKSISGF